MNLEETQKLLYQGVLAKNRRKIVLQIARNALLLKSSFETISRDTFSPLKPIYIPWFNKTKFLRHSNWGGNAVSKINHRHLPSLELNILLSKIQLHRCHKFNTFPPNQKAKRDSGLEKMSENKIKPLMSHSIKFLSDLL